LPAPTLARSRRRLRGRILLIAALPRGGALFCISGGRLGLVLLRQTGRCERAEREEGEGDQASGQGAAGVGHLLLNSSNHHVDPNCISYGHARDSSCRATAHVPKKWIPVFRKGHAQTKTLEHIPIVSNRDVL
jgi:hypothetical protein